MRRKVGSRQSYSLRRGVKIIEQDGGSVLFDPSSGGYYQLNSIGHFIVAHLLKETSPDHIVNEIVAKFEMSRDEVEGDVREYMERLLAVGVLR